MLEGMDDRQRARQLIDASERIVALTGAGISTDSGIPDFRGPQGVWTKNPQAERMSTLSAYLNDPEVRRAAWRNRFASAVWEARPNPGHLALVELERRGKLHTLITQNTDGLHQKAGSDPDKVVEIHGSMHWARCWRCGDRRPMAEVLKRVEAGEEDPSCQATDPSGQPCGGILKSDTISFGQNLVPEDVERMQEAALACDLMLAVGTSLTVHPAASAVPLAKGAGAKVVIVNNQPTPYDDLAEVVLREPISQVLPEIVRP
jgi:NAD-dependent deacetylase